MDFKQNQSLLDYLQQIIPNLNKLQNNFKFVDKNSQMLYDLWHQSDFSATTGKMRQPADFDQRDVLELEKMGYIQIQGKMIKLTSKGIKVVKKMILNDDHNAFEQSDSDQNLKFASSYKRIKNNWYSKIS